MTITVSDGPPTVDASDTFTWTVTNVNREPTFDQDVPSQTNAEGNVVSLDAGATDPDGDTLTYAATGLPAGLSINTTTGLITGTIAFTAAAGSPYTVNVTVRDGATVDQTDTFGWTVTNVNREPTFDQNVVDRTDAEGVPVNLDAGATDLDGDPLTYAATNLPPGLSINTTTGLITGTISFAAAAGSPYSVSVTVRDGVDVDATDLWTWTVTDVNGNPTFDQNLGNRTDPENGPPISLDAGGTDPDGDPLTYAATNLPPGLSINTTTGLITGTIAFTAAAGSPYNVTITVSDDPPTVDASDTFTWTVTNVNREPTFDQDVPSQTNAEGNVVSLDAGATDPDGDTLTYAATGLPAGLSINTTTGLITGTIAFTAAAGSPYTVNVTVRDGATVDQTDTFGWTVTNVNREPTFDQNVVDRTDAEGVPVNLDAGATDLDGDPLTYAATNLPPGLSINTTTGLITGTISFAAAAGSPYSVSVTVRDGVDVDATDLWTWTVTDVTPSASPVFKSASSASNNAIATTLVIPRPATFATGDLLLSSVTIRGSSTITPPAGWTVIRNDLNGTNLRQQTWYRFATAGEPATYTFTFSAGRLAVGTIHAYGGVHATTPIDASSGSINASSTSLTALGLTTTVANTRLVALYSMTTNATVAPPAGMTERSEQPGSEPTLPRMAVIEGSDQALGAAGATGNRVATASAAATSIGQLIALRPAAGGPPANNEPTFDQNLLNRTDPEGTVDQPRRRRHGPRRRSADLRRDQPAAGPVDQHVDRADHRHHQLGGGRLEPVRRVSITVRDGATVDATDAFTWTVTDVVVPNNEPTFDQNLPDRTDPEGTAINLDAGATDLDGDPLTYAATNLPPGLSINTSTGLITGTISSAAAAGSPYARQHHRARRGDGRCHRCVHLDRDRRGRSEQRADVRPEPARPDRSRGHGRQPRRRRHGPRWRSADVRRDQPAGRPVDQHLEPGLITGTISSVAAASSPYAVSITVRDGATVDATDTFTWTVTDVVAGAAPALRAVSSGSNNASTTSISLNRPTGTVAGDVMLASLSVRGTSTVTAPAGWTLIRTDTFTASLRMHTYWRSATGSDPASWTWTFSAVRLAAGAIHAYSGVNATTPIDANGGQAAGASSATATAPSITTTVANTRLVTFFANMSNSTWTAPAGFAERVDLVGTSPSQFTSLTSADVARPTAGATGASSATATASSGNVGQAIALRPAAGGPPPVNNEPTFDQNLPSRTDPEGTAISLDAGATDLDDDPLTYAATNLPPGLRSTPRPA